MKRRSSNLNSFRIDDIYSDPLVKTNFYLHYGDITDSLSVFNIIKNIKPDEIYNLAAQSHVGVSFEMPEYTTNTDALGTLRILEAIVKTNKKSNSIKLVVLKCLEKLLKHPKQKKHHFILEVHME